MVDTNQPPDDHAFAAMIREARTRRKLTQSALAQRAGVSLRCITRWEAGEATWPQPDQLGAVCAALGLSRPRALVALGYLADTDLAEVA
jgi:transcriptional regulator with XRE-family HTH domain